MSDPNKERSDEKQQSGYGRKAKRFVFSQFRKVKKELQRNNTRPSPGTSTFVGCSRYCLCFKQIPTLDSSGESPTSDPNSLEFTFDSLRALIEKNAFFFNECNTHLDVQTSTDDAK